MTIKQVIGKSIYNLIGRNMPLSDGRFSFGSKKVRAFCGKLIFEHCGKNVNIEKGARFSEHTTLGDNSGIGVNAFLTAHVSIGNDVMMGPDCMLFTSNHGMTDLSVPMWQQPSTEPRPIVIEDDVWIGARVIILPGVRVGKGSVIGAGSVVTHDVEAFSVVAGNPAKKIRDRRASTTRSI